MSIKDLPSRDYLHEALRYDAETGRLFWRTRPLGHFTSTPLRSPEWERNRWNSRHAGKEAFTARHKDGRRHGKVGPARCTAHRVVWKMAYGSEPDLIDHIDGNPANNRLENLRSATNTVNSRNRCISRANTSGVTGVRWQRDVAKWVAWITVDGKKQHLGSFSNLNDAIGERKLAERRHGFSERHGAVRHGVGV